MIGLQTPTAVAHLFIWKLADHTGLNYVETHTHILTGATAGQEL